MNLMDKIKTKTATVGVIGLGYVGLPLAVEKAKAGFNVVGFDIQKKKVEWVNQGKNYIGDVVDEDLKELVKKGKLRATTDYDEIASCDVVAICVPTPLDKFKQPDLTYIVNTSIEISKRLHPQMLVVLESTTYPGTTEEVVLPILEKSGLKVGKDFYLAFSPERVDPGNKRYKTKNTPKVVGGVTPECTKHAKALYEAVLEAEVFTVSSPKEAEMSKILENTFRIVNIALINEMAIVARKMGINIWEVIEAAATKPFGFMPFYPGPGVGGHCLRETEYVFIRENDRVFVTTIQKLFQKIEPREEEKIAIPSTNLEVLSWDVETGKPVWKKILLVTKRKYSGSMVHIKIQSGHTLTVTSDHPMVVLDNGSWRVKLAEGLKIGDKLPAVELNDIRKFDEIMPEAVLSAVSKQKDTIETIGKWKKRVYEYRFEESCNSQLEVTDIQREESDEFVYSIEVEGTHTFVTTGGVVVHNCIPIDPFYLTYKAREYDYHTRLIELAGEINDFMPEYVVNRLAEMLNERKKCLNGSKILVLGVAYKGDVDDIRESPALKVIQHLERRYAEVLYHDPYIPQFEMNGKVYKSVELTEKLLKEVDAVVITTAHKKNVDYEFVVEHAELVFDTKNVMKDIKKFREKIELL